MDKLFRKFSMALMLFTLTVCGHGTIAFAITIGTGLDTYVREARANNSYGGETRAEWDGSDGGGENHGLLYFQIFQDEGGAVDPAIIAAASNFKAYLRLDVVNEGDGGAFHRLTQAFDNNSTWNSLGGSGVLPGTNAVLSADLTTPDLSTGLQEFDVTSSVEAWAANPGSNYGWGILPTGSNGVEFSTFDSGSQPELVLAMEDTYLSAGSVWNYYDSIFAGDSSYPTDGSGNAWSDSNFDDSSWASGSGQLGYGDGDETTIVNSNNITYLFRTQFAVGDIPDELVLDLLRDDGASVYLNGVEVIRDNLPGTLGDGGIDAGTVALTSSGTENKLTSFVLDPALLNANQFNTLAIEVHNRSTSSSDISFDLAFRGITQLSATLPIPEPNSALLLGVGLIAMTLRRKRRLSV